MADKTYREALADNELVGATPGPGQELIMGGEVFGATAQISDLDSGVRFDTFRNWTIDSYPGGIMLQSVYDPDLSGIVNAAEQVDDGLGNSKTAAEIAGHINSGDIHRALNDAITSNVALWSSLKISNELGLKADNSALTSHIINVNNPHATTHENLGGDTGVKTHTQLDAHVDDILGNPHQVTHAQVSPGDLFSHAQIDSHLGIVSGNPHGVTHGMVSPGDIFTHSQIDGHINSSANPHGVTAAQAGAAPSSHVGDTSHLSTDERNAITFATAPPTQLNPFATLIDIPPASGHDIQDEGVTLPTQRALLNFTGAGVVAQDNPGNASTDVVINATGDVGGPPGAVADNLSAFDSTSGKIIKDAGYAMPAGGAIGQVLGKSSASDYDWTWISQSVSGDVFGPASAVNDNVPLFNGPSGKLIKDGSLTRSEILSLLVPNQFVTVTPITPASADRVLVEDADASFQKRYVTVGDLTGGGGVPEAPADGTTYFRRDSAWTRVLQGYGDQHQNTLTSGGPQTILVSNGNTIVSNLVGAYELGGLTAAETSMSCTWVLQHNGFTVILPVNFIYPGGTLPDLSSGNAALVGLFTVSGGTTWIISYIVDYTL